MWLASTSVRSRSGATIPTYEWSKRNIANAERRLRAVLEGVGDETRERFFRMCITACFHRALSAAEIANLPAAVCDLRPRDLAGGPVEVFWSKGTVDAPSTKPCEQPGRTWLTKKLYLPTDCGHCEPCLARKALAPKRF